METKGDVKSLGGFKLEHISGCHKDLSTSFACGVELYQRDPEEKERENPVTPAFLSHLPLVTPTPPRPCHER